MKFNKKRLGGLILAAVLMIFTVGCGMTDNDSKSISRSNDSDNAPTVTESVDLGKVLIVYFSYTGNTEKLIKMLPCL